MNINDKLELFMKDCKRVLKISKKPDKEEYFTFSKVTTLGMIIIGVIGFVIVLIGQLIGL